MMSADSCSCVSCKGLRKRELQAVALLIICHKMIRRLRLIMHFRIRSRPAISAHILFFVKTRGVGTLLLRGPITAKAIGSYSVLCRNFTDREVYPIQRLSLEFGCRDHDNFFMSTKLANKFLVKTSTVKKLSNSA